MRLSFGLCDPATCVHELEPVAAQRKYGDGSRIDWFWCARCATWTRETYEASDVYPVEVYQGDDMDGAA
jgi:hypothetical protein